MGPNIKRDGSIVATVSPERVLSVDMRLERRATQDAGKTKMATTMLRRKDVLYVVSLLCLFASCAPRDAYCGFKSCDNASASALGEPWKGGS